MSRKNPIGALALAAGLFLLAACGQSPDPAKVADTSPAAKRPATVAASGDRDWVLAPRSSGVEMPVVLRFELPERPVVGNGFSVNLRLEAPEAVEGLSLRMELPEGLASVGAPLALTEPRVPAGGKIEHRLALKAAREGMFEGRFRVTLAAGSGKEQSAVFSIPLIVGAVAKP